MPKPTRKRKPRKRPIPMSAPMPMPLPVVMLTIDSARTSGLAMYVHGHLVSYHECDARNHTERTRAITEAVATARVRGLHCVAVIEVPWSGGRRRAELSLTQTAALWRDSWTRAGQPDALCIDRTAGQWRRLLFGNTTRAAARRLEALIAEQVAAKDLPGRVHRIGPDAAAAICIGQTQIRSRELHHLLARYSV